MPKKTVLLFIFLLLSMSCNCFHIKLPNKYNLLYKKILLSEKTLNYSTQQFLSSTQKQSQINQDNSMKLIYQMFLFPYRIYSYFNQKGKKVFLMDKVGIREFQVMYQGSEGKQDEGFIGQDKDLLETQFNVRNCLYNSSTSCFSQSQLYQLIPQHLMLTPQPQQQLILIGTPSQLLLKSHHSSSRSLYLIKLNLHRYIYQARQTILKYLYDRVEGKEDQKYQIRMGSFFNKDQEIYNVLGQKLGFDGLVEVKHTVQVGNKAIYTYQSTAQILYLTQIQQHQCPDTSDILTYSLYVNQKPTISIQKCLYLRLHKINLYQSTSPSKTQYISKSSQFLHIKSISSRLNEDNLTIEYFSEKKSFQIQYGQKWKSITKMEWQPRILIQILFLSNTKVYVFNNSIILYTKRNHLWHQGVQLNFTSFLLTAQKINNQHFVVCVEPSICIIYNVQFKEIAKLQFENAFGIEWNYKINYSGNRTIAYVQALKRSANIHRIINIGLDTSYIPLPHLPAGSYHMNYTILQPIPYFFTLSQMIQKSIIQVQSKPTSTQIILKPTFSTSQQLVSFRRQRLFQDEIYSNVTRFKEHFLDDALRGYLGNFVGKAYFPAVPNFNQIKQTRNQLGLIDVYNPYKMQVLFSSSCNFNSSTNTIHFINNWNFCKVVINTDSMMVIDSIITNTTTYNNPNLKQQTNIQTLENKKNYKVATKQDNQITRKQQNQNTKQQQRPQKQLQQTRQITMQTPSDQSQQGNSTQMIICVIKKNSPPYQQCKVTSYTVSDTFTKKKKQLKQLKFFLSSSQRYFHIYFIRYQYQSNDKLSLLQILENLVKEQKDNTNQPGDNRLEEVKILVNTKQNINVDIVLRDYQQQERETISKILMVSYCVFIPAIAFVCCFVYFKNYIISFLALYGFIQIPSNYTYPLSTMSLRLKKKQLQKNGYTKVYHKKPLTCQTIPIPNEQQNHIQQCCFCLQTIKISQQILQLYCCHVFHSECFFEWIKNEPNTKCPLCKRSLTLKAVKQYQKLRKQNQKLKKLNQKLNILNTLSEDSDVRNDIAQTNLSMIGD